MSLLLYIVFGFYQDSFVGVEQEQGYTVQTGYQKGAAFVGTNLLFSVISIPGTASEFTVSYFEQQNLTKICTVNRRGCRF